MRPLAKTEDEKNALKALELQVERLTERVDAFRDAMSEAVVSGFGQLFADIGTGSKTALDAFKDFAAGVARAALNLAGQELGKKIAASLFQDGGGSDYSGAIGNFFASLLAHHDGGVIGNSGTPRTLGMGTVLAAAAAGLPYYHRGGISGLGLRSDEELAVLQKGEEVLTADNPRHARNFRQQIGNLVISTKVEGAQGGNVEMQGAGDRLNAAVLDTINRWAVDESREGGILAGRKP